MLKKILLLTIIAVSPALADGVGVIGLTQFPETDGQGIYNASCAGCHMPDGKGATGAATYPSFVKNENLNNPVYAREVVLYGLNGMPALGGVLNDQQIANVVNYIRTHFGNDYKDLSVEADVKALRDPNHDYNDLN